MAIVSFIWKAEEKTLSLVPYILYSFKAEIQNYVSQRNIMTSLGELIKTDNDVFLNTSKVLVDLLKNNGMWLSCYEFFALWFGNS
jgi:hypothetical protein